MIEGKEAGGAIGALRYGMIGGSQGSFIGGVHRSAINLVPSAVLVAGCFSSKKEKTLETGAQYGLEQDRLYNDFFEMAEKEGAREDKIDFVVIATTNKTHYTAARAFLERGIHVMCEKPVTVTVEEAVELKKLAAENNCLFCVSYTYTGHVMAREARNLIKCGEIGDVIMVMGEYVQDWLIDKIEGGQQQAAWRTSPEEAGKSNCTGDIGTHIENLVHYMTGLKIKKLCAKMNIIGEGRTLDTNSQMMVEYDNGANGVYWCSQVAIGYDNALKVRIFGTLGAIEYDQEASNYLRVTKKNCPPQLYSRGCGYISEEAAAYSRLPSGHPEGYHEALSNIYTDFTRAIRMVKNNELVDEAEMGYPTIDMGVDGVMFVDKCVESSAKGSVWVNME